MGSHLRTLLRHLHAWAGLALGVPLLVLGLTGSALVFYTDLDAFLNPQIRTEATAPAAGWDSPVWDRALATVRETWPGQAGKWSFEVTGAPGAIPARYYAATDMHGHMSDPLMIWLTSDGAQVLRHARWGDYLMTWFYDVHRNLLAGETGNWVVGWLGVAMLLLLLSGVAVWWPRGSWQKALAFKRGASPIRRLRDLHKLFGLWSLVLLLLFAATGALLALPAERTWLLSTAVAPVVPLPTPVSSAAQGRQISVAQALTAAHRALPEARLAWIDVPGPGDGVFRLRVQVPGDPHRRFPQSYVFIDQYSGAVLAIHDVRRGTASSAVNAWIRPLHDGTIGGLGTQILAVVSGLVPVVLFITGLLHWRTRRASAHRARSRHQASNRGHS